MALYENLIQAGLGQLDGANVAACICLENDTVGCESCGGYGFLVDGKPADKPSLVLRVADRGRLNCGGEPAWSNLG